MAKKHWAMVAAALVACGGGIVTLCAGAVFGVPCVSTGVSYGLWLDTCPAGTPSLAVSVTANRLLRSDEGRVIIEPSATFVYDWDDADRQRTHAIHRGFRSVLTLLDEDGEVVDGLEVTQDSRKVFDVVLPDVPDGDYTLRAEVEAGFGRQVVDLAVPLYTPAIAFVQTDRPLYQPGQDVLLRGVLLERTTLDPIDDRPAQWRITNPRGEQMLIEDDRAGAFGILDTRFPIDRFAENGVWTASLVSGDSSDEVSFEVRPFKLPRVQADLTSDARWYGIGDEVRLTGRATYTSGAPIADAPVTVQLFAGTGRWPMPLDWAEPMTARTNAQGRFDVTVGEVPADLIEHNTLRAVARITEAAGEVATGMSTVRLSVDDLKVEAITELDGGLVEGANNRVWLRVSTPDGVALPGATVFVDNPWDGEDEPRTAVADADGVAAVQIDPGPAVSVRTPAAPVRVAEERTQPVRLNSAAVVGGGSLGLDGRRVLETRIAAMSACQDLTTEYATARVVLGVDASGRVTRSLSAPDAVSACVEQALQGTRFAADEGMMLDLRWDIPPAVRPSLTVTPYWSLGANLDTTVGASLRAASLRARRCLPDDVPERATLFHANWRIEKGSERLVVDARSDEPSPGVSSATVTCVARELTSVELSREATTDALGTLTIDVIPAPRASTPQPRPTVTRGYELMVRAAVGEGDEQTEVGQTRVVLTPGVVPPLRLRSTPSLAAPGDTLTIAALRGPDFRGTFPDEVSLMQGTRELARVPFDADSRTATFTIPDDTDGFVYVQMAGARTVVFVSESDPLSVQLSSDAATYRPGETATITVSTRAGGRGVAAGVGLSGLDKSLEQLGTLLGPDAMSRVTVRAESDAPAFERFGAAALAMGQIRGENAAQAALLTVSTLPMDASGDVRVAVSGYAQDNVAEALIEPFFRARAEVIQRIAAWEASADEGDVLLPADVVEHWQAVLDAEAGAERPVTDLYGRPLALQRLPSDLLRQLAPSELVRDRTRLPEDVIDWERWVASEVR